MQKITLSKYISNSRKPVENVITPVVPGKCIRSRQCRICLVVEGGKKETCVEGEGIASCKRNASKQMQPRKGIRVLKVRGCRDAVNAIKYCRHQHSVSASYIHSGWPAVKARIHVWCSVGTRWGWKANLIFFFFFSFLKSEAGSKQSAFPSWEVWWMNSMYPHRCLCVYFFLLFFFYNVTRIICLLIAVAKVTYSCTCIHCYAAYYAASLKAKQVQV